MEDKNKEEKSEEVKNEEAKKQEEKMKNEESNNKKIENKQTNEMIFSDMTNADSREIIEAQNVEDFLLAFEKIKYDYDVEEVQEILNLMKEEYIKSNSKKLVKEK